MYKRTDKKNQFRELDGVKSLPVLSLSAAHGIISSYLIFIYLEQDISGPGHYNSLVLSYLFLI